jgi:hypothetical protein
VKNFFHLTFIFGLVFKSTTPQRNLKWGFHCIWTNDILAVWQHGDKFHIITNHCHHQISYTSISISGYPWKHFLKVISVQWLHHSIWLQQTQHQIASVTFSVSEKDTVHCFTNAAAYQTKKNRLYCGCLPCDTAVLWMVTNSFKATQCLHLRWTLLSVITWKPQYRSSQLWKPLTSHPLGYFSLKHFMHCKTVGALRQIYCI